MISNAFHSCQPNSSNVFITKKLRLSAECGSEEWLNETVLLKFGFDLQYTICNFGNFRNLRNFGNCDEIGGISMGG